MAAVALSNRRGSLSSVRSPFAALRARRRRTQAAWIAWLPSGNRRGSLSSVRSLFAALGADSTFYRWRKRYGQAMAAAAPTLSPEQQLRHAEAENRRLRKLLSDLDRMSA